MVRTEREVGRTERKLTQLWGEVLEGIDTCLYHSKFAFGPLTDTRVFVRFCLFTI